MSIADAPELQLSVAGVTSKPRFATEVDNPK